MKNREEEKKIALTLTDYHPGCDIVIKESRECFDSVLQAMAFYKAKEISGPLFAGGLLETNDPFKLKILYGKLKFHDETAKKQWKMSRKQRLLQITRLKFAQNPGLIKNLMETDIRRLARVISKEYMQILETVKQELNK